MSRSVLIALIVSLTLNVFLLGVGVGVFATGAKLTVSGPQKAKPPNLWEAAQALPEADRVRFRAMLHQEAAAVQPPLMTVRANRQQAAALMADANLDPVAVSGALQRARDAEIAARGEVDRGILAYLTKMPQTERAELAEAMIRSGAPSVRQSVQDGEAAGAATPPRSNP